jgi:hypothetical protein
MDFQLKFSAKRMVFGASIAYRIKAKARLAHFPA